jgi:hypothetical protein
MADLMEAAPSLSARGWYEWRQREIALAHYVRRQRANYSSVQHSAPVLHERRFAATKGRMSVDTRDRWLQLLVGGQADVVRGTLRDFRGLLLSRVGVGTFMGDAAAATDAKYVDAIAGAVKRGINVVDTAINYRDMQAERCVGRALKRLEAMGLERSMVLVCTKGGFIPKDAANTSA